MPKTPCITAAIVPGASVFLWLSAQAVPSALTRKWLPKRFHQLLPGSGCLPRPANGKVDGSRSNMLLSVAGMRIPNTHGVRELCSTVRRPCLRVAGYDQFHPISKKSSMMSPKGLGWIIVDSLDTMMNNFYVTTI
jgi:hypothetical protein